MPRFPLREAEADSLVGLPKVIRDNIVWTQRPNKSWLESRVDVLGDFKGQLQLLTTVNAEIPSKFSITLLLNGDHAIRGLHLGSSHTNKCSDRRSWYYDTHKHVWSDVCPPHAHAYTPANITVTSLAEVFRQFCQECNIDFQGLFKDPIFKPEFPGI